MKGLAIALPGPLSRVSGGTIYDLRLARAWVAAGRNAQIIELPGGFPAPTEAELNSAMRRLAAVPADVPLVIDGLAFGALPAERIAALRRPVAALVHHPLCMESGLSDTMAAQLAASERTALAHAAAIIVPSRTTAADVMRLFAPPCAPQIVPPGTDAGRRARPDTAAPPLILAVGAIIPRKGYDLLIDALSGVAGEWRLVIAGAQDADPACFQRLVQQLEEAGLSQRTALMGPLPRMHLAVFYESAALFVSASHHEGYGMALADALAHGLPIVAAAGGAAAELVPEAAGKLVPPGDRAALQKALTLLLGDAPARTAAADASWAAGQGLPGWDAAAACAATVLDGMT